MTPEHLDEMYNITEGVRVECYEMVDIIRALNVMNPQVGARLHFAQTYIIKSMDTLNRLAGKIVSHEVSEAQVSTANMLQAVLAVTKGTDSFNEG